MFSVSFHLPPCNSVLATLEFIIHYCWPSCCELALQDLSSTRYTLAPLNKISPTCPQHLGTTILLSVFRSSAFLDSTYKWDQSVFVFLCLISLSITPSRSTHAVVDGSISFFSWLNNTPLYRRICMYVCVYVCPYISHLLYPFIHWQTLRLFPYLGYCE